MLEKRGNWFGVMALLGFLGITIILRYGDEIFSYSQNLLYALYIASMMLLFVFLPPYLIFLQIQAGLINKLRLIRIKEAGKAINPWFLLFAVYLLITIALGGVIIHTMGLIYLISLVGIPIIIVFIAAIISFYKFCLAYKKYGFIAHKKRAA